MSFASLNVSLKFCISNYVELVSFFRDRSSDDCFYKIVDVESKLVLQSRYQGLITRPREKYRHGYTLQVPPGPYELNQGLLVFLKSGSWLLL